MANLSDYLENKLLDHILRNVPWASPTTVYAALYINDPTDADTGTEVTGGGYARQAITFSAPSDGETTNVADVIFPEATANWGNITHIGIRDAATGGNLLFHGELQANKIIESGDQFILKAGEITAVMR